MKKAILISGIVWMVLCLAGGLFEILYGIGQLTPLKSGSVDWQPDYVLGTANICIGCYLVVGIALTVLLILKRNSEMNKTKGLVLGIVAAVFGALVPGVLFAVDSVKTRQ